MSKLRRNPKNESGIVALVDFYARFACTIFLYIALVAASPISRAGPG